MQADQPMQAAEQNRGFAPSRQKNITGTAAPIQKYPIPHNLVAYRHLLKPERRNGDYPNQQQMFRLQYKNDIWDTPEATMLAKRLNIPNVNTGEASPIRYQDILNTLSTWPSNDLNYSNVNYSGGNAWPERSRELYASIANEYGAISDEQYRRMMSALNEKHW